jgi:hypothetical protein
MYKFPEKTSKRYGSRMGAFSNNNVTDADAFSDEMEWSVNGAKITLLFCASDLMPIKMYEYKACRSRRR